MLDDPVSHHASMTGKSRSLAEGSFLIPGGHARASVGNWTSGGSFLQ